MRTLNITKTNTTYILWLQTAILICSVQNLCSDITPDRLDTGLRGHGVDQHHPLPIVQELPCLNTCQGGVTPNLDICSDFLNDKDVRNT